MALSQEILSLTSKKRLDFNTINTALKAIKADLHNLTTQKGWQKRIYSICVEALENIFKHFEIDDEDLHYIIKHPTFFKLYKINNEIHIETGNLIYKHNALKLQNKLKLVSGLQKDALDKYYLQEVSNGKISVKGNAGIGLIKMAKKSSNKLTFEFLPIENRVQYYKLHVIADVS